MNHLLDEIQKLKTSPVHTLIAQRIQEFKTVDINSPDEVFTELCFCILTANFSAQRGITIHQQLKSCFFTDTQDTLEKKLRACGYRFPHTRAQYITSSAHRKQLIQHHIVTLDGEDRRHWLVNNVAGLGYKEASHFLRNIGFDTYAIIDSHILNLLTQHNLILEPKPLTKKKYLEIEHVLQTIASQAQLTLAELDLYLWYMETGTVLK
ncbi:MAG: N-glycosylase/DNA lyase [Candidatus Thermoplasmatota archaeon]|nr:N-glycosylase/DNA lyase [Candidatus Thermoplasmatota archaeon]